MDFGAILPALPVLLEGMRMTFELMLPGAHGAQQFVHPRISISPLVADQGVVTGQGNRSAAHPLGLRLEGHCRKERAPDRPLLAERPEKGFELVPDELRPRLCKRSCN